MLLLPGNAALSANTMPENTAIPPNTATPANTAMTDRELLSVRVATLIENN